MSKKGLIGLLAAITSVLLIIFLVTMVVKVKEGEVAVVYSPNGGAKEVLNPGWNVIKPWEDITVYPTKITFVDTNVTATTKDGKKVTMPARYEMKVDKSKVLKIFKELGSQNIEQLQEGYLYQRLYKSARAEISKYSVVEIYSEGVLKVGISVAEAMAKNSEELGFIVTDVVFGTPALDEKTQSAIDARVEAAQKLEKLEIEKNIATQEAEKKEIEANGEAIKLTIEAQAAADAEIIRAEGEARANELLTESINQTIIDLNISKARLQHGWVTVQGAQPLVEVKP